MSPDAYGFWLLSAGYAAIPFTLSVVMSVTGDEPGSIMWAYEKCILGMSVLFFIFGCVAESV